MQRTPSLPVIVHCPHHGRTVRATRNTATDRLVACDEGEQCKAPQPASSPGEAAKTYPHACPVYPSLAK